MYVNGKMKYVEIFQEWGRGNKRRMMDGDELNIFDTL
jgi:hypothetical protein